MELPPVVTTKELENLKKNMNRPSESQIQRTKVKIKIMEAFLNGKTIQILQGGSWNDETDPNWFDNAYRIKPEPREFFIVYNENAPKLNLPSTYVDGERAKEHFKNAKLDDEDGWTILKVREII